MARRKRIGLLFENYGEAWTGGEYYLLNIIRSLQYLKGDEPNLIVFYSNAEIIERVSQLNYSGVITFTPIIKPVKRVYRVINRITLKLIGKDFHIGESYSASTADFIYPCLYSFLDTNRSFRKLRKVYWIPDFQHKYLPKFFSLEELAYRDANVEALSILHETIVFSSNDVQTDFRMFYPKHNATSKVIRFASVLPAIDHIDFQKLKIKFGLNQAPLFISPNQFWAHKNHIVILKAVVLLKAEGLQFQVVFTGKEHDYRHPDYTNSLKEFVRDNNIGDTVKFLGFIDRAEQLQIMKHARAVIQPSLFEGWSTVIEDAKALNKSVIVSNLKVHREQCQESGFYFEPNSEIQLAKLLREQALKEISLSESKYEQEIVRFAQEIVEL